MSFWKDLDNVPTVVYVSVAVWHVKCLQWEEATAWDNHQNRCIRIHMMRMVHEAPKSQFIQELILLSTRTCDSHSFTAQVQTHSGLNGQKICTPAAAVHLCNNQYAAFYLQTTDMSSCCAFVSFQRHQCCFICFHACALFHTLSTVMNDEW